MVTYLKNLQTCGSRDAEYAQILFERIGEQARLICKGVRLTNGVYRSFGAVWCMITHLSCPQLASRSPSTSGGSGGTREVCAVASLGRSAHLAHSTGASTQPPLCETVFCWIRSLPYLMIAHA